jgi:hypothetical protein
MIEVVIVMGILASAVLPIYRLIVGTQLTTTKARFSYIALHLAREKVEEMISLPFDNIKSEAWTKIEGPVVSEELMKASGSSIARARTAVATSFAGGFTGGARVGSLGGAGLSVIDANAEVGEGDYPLEYQRFQRNVKVTKKGKRLKLVTVEVKWFEAGERDERRNNYLYALSTLVGDHHLSSYR